MERADIAIIGTGPGGVSAALTAKVRNKNILLIGKKQMSDKVSKAHQIMNYPGQQLPRSHSVYSSLYDFQGENNLQNLDLRESFRG